MLSVYLGAAAIVLAVPLTWYAVAGGRLPSVRVADDGGSASATDLRELSLGRSARERLFDPAVAGLARRTRRLTPVGLIEQLDQRIEMAGFGARWPLERVLAAKLLLGMAGAMFGLLQVAGGVSLRSLLLAVFTTAIGYFAPDIILTGRAQERQKAIGKALPDLLDQVSISVEAGLGFESALAQATKDVDGPLAAEIGRTLQDIRIGVSRRQALDNLTRRTDVPDLRHFVVALRQAEEYGVPIAQVLRVQSGELRDKRRRRAEEQAMKIPVKITFPVVLCIFPALFVVLAGPAAIQLWENVAS